MEYQPIPVKDILKKMKDMSSVMIDLAYYSAIYSDETLVDEILKLGENVDRLELQLMMQAALATRSADDAENIVSIFVLAASVAKISDATEEIARISRSNLSLRFPVHAPGMDDVVFRVKVSPASWADGRSLNELFQKQRRVLDVLLVRRGDKWILEPDPKFVLRGEDTLFAVGLVGNVRKFKEAFGIAEPASPLKEFPAIYKSLTEWLVQFMNFSDFIVDTAYTSLLTSSYDLAENVSDIEEYMDNMLPKFEQQVLSTTDLSTNDKAALIRIAQESERISDAARDIGEVILFGLEPHPIIADVLQESSERISIVRAGDEEDGRSIKDLGYENYGAVVFAVKRKKKWHIRPPHATFKVKKGDLLIVKYIVEASVLEGFPEELKSEEEIERAIEEVRKEEQSEEGGSSEEITD